AAYKEVSGTEEIIPVSEEQDFADIIGEQKPTHKNIRKTEPKRQIPKILQKPVVQAQKQQNVHALKQTPKPAEKPAVMRAEKKPELVQEGISWGWVAALIIFLLIAGIAWKYWPQATLPIVASEVAVVPLEPNAQNNTQLNESAEIPATSEYATADEAIGGLSDQLRG
ncbi:MAG: hypothetical protein Q7K43_02635, partial [Candidatus Woesearchaeota archaeon]|nr:hypothetical protein [Candidatus Woesearchaeota archaeon]